MALAPKQIRNPKQLRTSTNGNTKLMAETASGPTKCPTSIESAVWASCVAAAVRTAANKKFRSALDMTNGFLFFQLKVFRKVAQFI